METTRIPLILAREARALDVGAALERDVRSGLVVRVARGAYAPREIWEAAEELERQHARIRAIASTRRESVLVGESAAVLRGLPLIDGLDSRVHVLSRTAVGSRSRRGLVEHRRAVEPEIEEVDGLAVESMTDTVVDLLRFSPFRRGVVLLDAVLRRELLAGRDPDELRDAADRLRIRFGPGRGTRVAKEVLAFGDPASESVLESLSRAVIRQAGFPAPELQRAWRLSDGRTIRTDFYWTQADLVGEADGAGKYELLAQERGYTVREAVLEEKRRENALRSLGPRVARWEWSEAHAVGPLVSALTAAGLRRIRVATRYPTGSTTIRRAVS